MDAENDCSLCGQGKYSGSAGSNSEINCQKCPPGSYSTSSGATLVDTCTSCAAGKSNSNTGSISEGACGVCPADTFCIVRSGSPAQCTGNTTSLAQSKVSTDCVCKPGHFGSNGGPCAACASGTYKPQKGLGSCTNCAVNTFSELPSQTDVSTCQKCPIDSSTEDRLGQSSVDDCVCNQGHYEGPDDANAVWTCDECLMGTYKNAPGNFDCSKCPANTFLTLFGANFSSQCEHCTPFSTSPEASKSNTTCQCIAGYYGNGQIGCTPCPMGTYNDLTNQAQCKVCAAGKYNALTAQTSEGSCTSCSSNSNSPQTSTVITACTCNSGYTGPNGGACTGCVAGKYKIATGAAACTLCVTGKFSTTLAATSDVCQDCKAGSYSAKTGNKAQSECDNCPAGTFSTTVSAISSATCIFCDAGKYQMSTGADSSSDCSQCPVGKSRPYGNL